MHKRGVRILPRSDLGFAWMPHGTNANDLQHFVDSIDDVHVGFASCNSTR